ncbi:hypothetical protein T492DRAFT_1132371 [Pavlovales sp. CCMP2436]|nr:hypothetical protein T492DRAFT_1132371 [Pavlovales sp. CCMP2436]
MKKKKNIPLLRLRQLQKPTSIPATTLAPQADANALSSLSADSLEGKGPGAGQGAGAGVGGFVGGGDLFVPLFSKLDRDILTSVGRPFGIRFPSTLSVLNSLRAWLGQTPPLASLHALKRLDGLEAERAEEEEQQGGSADELEALELMATMSSRTRDLGSALLRGASFLGVSAGSDATERPLREALVGAMVY